MIIGIDLDEVLADYLSAFIAFHNETYGTTLKTEDFFTYKFWQIAQFPREDTLKRFMEFHKTHHFLQVKPTVGAISAINQLKRDGHTLILISSRQKSIDLETKDWLNKYFPRSFTKVCLLNHFSDTHGGYRTKSSVCKGFHLDILIEDQFEYAKECASNQTRVLLFDKPWNKEAEISDTIVRVTSWKNILEYVQMIKQNP